MRRFLGAIQFLTVIPVRAATASPGRAALFFPLIGAAIGWIGGHWLRLLDASFGSNIAALLVIAFWTLITGALHEDGLADVADALRAQRTRQRMLEILKDPRIGSFGAVALLLVTLLRWQALVRMPSSPHWELAACMALSRAAMVAMAWLTPPAGDGLGAAFARSLTSMTAAGAILLAIACALPAGWTVAVLVPASACSVFLLRNWFMGRLEGVNGDCLGATSLLTETFLMILVSCRNCFFW